MISEVKSSFLIHSQSKRLRYSVNTFIEKNTVGHPDYRKAHFARNLEMASVRWQKKESRNLGGYAGNISQLNVTP